MFLNAKNQRHPKQIDAKETRETRGALVALRLAERKVFRQ
jgi:hypothetical protein